MDCEYIIGCSAMKAITGSIILVVAFAATTVFAAQSPTSKRVETLQRERASLSQTTDAVRRARGEMKISDLVLEFISDSVRADNVDSLDANINDYRAAILDARDSLVQSRRDPLRKPQGFRDVELALRRQSRRLDDLAKELPVEQRQQINKLIEEVKVIRNEMLNAILGTALHPNF
jgi:hypothetical protein